MESHIGEKGRLCLQVDGNSLEQTARVETKRSPGNPLAGRAHDLKKMTE